MEANSVRVPPEYSTGFTTKAIHVGNEPDPQTHAVTVPIYPVSTFEIVGGQQKYVYSRVLNPTVAALEANLASLEHAKLCVCAGSGMGACTVIMHLFKAGETVLCSENVYPEVRKYMEGLAKTAQGLNIEFVDMANVELVKEKLTTGAKGVWLESPAGPTLEVFDIEALAKVCDEHKAILIVDNSTLSPYLQNPLDLGASIVMDSCSNAICGHNDVLMGAVMANDPELFGRVKKNSYLTGVITSPFDAFLVLRGVKTLGPRADDSEKNANELAKFLASHEKVKECFYPGLASHKGHELLKKQARGFGPLIGLEVKGDENSGKKLVESLQFFVNAVGKGSVESMAYVPALTEYKESSESFCSKIGLTKNLVMLSIGIEDLEDLKNDLNQALSKI